jgi:hypothetical protein
MRAAVAIVLVGTLALAQEPKLAKQRHGVEIDRENFLQTTPKDTLESIVKAIQMKNIPYVVAQLADPMFVDQRVADVHEGSFEKMVRETSAQLADNPDTLKMFRRYLKEGKWDEQGNTASARLDDTKDALYFRKINERWFLENRKRAGK